MTCCDCPRKCGADRENGGVGYCGGGYNARVAKIIRDFAYEEPCLGKTVDAVFFGGCALRCSYCQNYKISRGGAGDEYDDVKLAELFDGMDNRIDLVTPSHYLSAVERAVTRCKTPHSFVYNTSGYETIGAVRRAGEMCDVFLTDHKYAESETARILSSAPDYPEIAIAAAKEMKRLKPDVLSDDGILKQGVVVRHLVLPGHVDNSIKALDMIASELGTNTVLSLMSQFTPNGVGEPSVRLKKIEYKLVAEHAVKLGFKTGYLQDFASADGTYIPKF